MIKISSRPYIRIYINGKLKYSIINTNSTYMCLLKTGDLVDLIHSSGDFEEFEIKNPEVYQFYMTKEGNIGSSYRKDEE